MADYKSVMLCSTLFSTSWFRYSSKNCCMHSKLSPKMGDTCLPKRDHQLPQHDILLASFVDYAQKEQAAQQNNAAIQDQQHKLITQLS